MNFIDAYEVSGTATPPASAADQQTQQSLNEEVSQVIGQLNRFWGGFRKQSQTAIETARKDFGQVVEQAQKELTKLNSPGAAAAVTSSEPSTTEEDSATKEHADLSEHPDRSSSPSSSTTETPRASSSSTNFSPQSLFTRLQSSLPPNIVSTVQSHIPPLDSIRHATSQSVDFAQLRTTLTSEFQRVQGVTRAQAEEYVHKSEELLREAVKEAGEFIKDAVKVVPPEEQGDDSVGVLWDGSDVWMLPSAYPESSPTDEASGKGKETDRTSGDARRAVATRAESLLRRLRHDPDIIKADPEADEGVKTLYDDWLRDEVVDKGGIHSPEWIEKRKAASNLLGDEDGFKTLQNSLVPSNMTEDSFWTKYFFRAYQIDREAERRRALIQAPSDSEDAFSWEDDEEESASPTARVTPSAELSSTKVHSALPSQLTSGTLSPRDDSEASYDIVSNNSEDQSHKKDQVHEKEQDEDDEDEDDDEDDEGGEEGEGDSDWE